MLFIVLFLHWPVMGLYNFLYGLIRCAKHKQNEDKLHVEQHFVQKLNSHHFHFPNEKKDNKINRRCKMFSFNVLSYKITPTSK